MAGELLNNLTLLAELRGHRTARMQGLSAEFINAINKITVTIFNDEVEIQYNIYKHNAKETLSIDLGFEFLDDVLQRKERRPVTLNTCPSMKPNDWRDQLSASLLKIDEEKSNDHYLRHFTIDSGRFLLEYFDDIVVIKDKQKEFCTGVFKLKDALQQCQ